MNEIYLKQLQTEVQLRNFAPSTERMYYICIRQFVEYTKKQQRNYTTEDVRAFLFFKKKSGSKTKTVNLYNAALRFFVRHILHQQWDWDLLPRMRVNRTLPTILTQEEIQQILDVTKNLKHKAMLATMYSSGLRVSEVCHLHYEDVSRRRMQIHIRQTKNKSDRYVILSKRNLELLSDYWLQYGRPKEILFPSAITGSYLTQSTLSLVLKESAFRAGIEKNVHCHLLRHAFACHLLEAGVDKTNIQLLLGHLSPHSTDVYLHMTNKARMGIKSPFNNVGGESDE